MSTGLNTLQFPSGSGTDGRQSSHWKADELTGTLIGVMDPTLSSGFIETVSSADFRALDLIGWDGLDRRRTRKAGTKLRNEAPQFCPC
jgi:hypothetical protein